MAKSKGPKWYAIRKGRDGRQIVTTWEACEAQVKGFAAAKYKSFPSHAEAKSWLGNYDEPILLSPSPSPVKESERTIPGLSAPPAGTRFSPYHPKKPVRDPSSSPVQYQERHSVLAKSSSIINNATSVLYSDPSSSPIASSSKVLVEDDLAAGNGFINLDNGEEVKEVEPVPVLQLNKQQAGVLAKVRAGENVFFTGSAGTGKSVLTREIIKTLRDENRTVYVTASTGIAAVNIGGSTLHSFAGLGLAKETKEKCLGKLLGPYASNTRKRWNACQALVIDEVSMVDGEFFDKLEFVARKIRGKETQPFGGIQLIVTGDFFQLPPVGNKGQPAPLFAFQASSWKQCFAQANMINLGQVFRQKDQTFVDMLNEMRSGSLTNITIKQFAALRRDITYTEGAAPVHLYPINSKVSAANETELRKLKAKEWRFEARDHRGVYLENDNFTNTVQKGIKTAEKLDKDTMAPRILLLKEGAQVMLVKNLSEGGLVNGSIGKIVGFKSAAQAQGQPGEEDPEMGEIEIAHAQDNKRKDDDEWHGSTATRRGIKGKEQPIPAGQWPVVEFTSGQTMLLPPMEFIVENADSKVECQRTQVPLILAWALSIHKSQGQTLQRVFIDLTGTFEKGQAYVALSRATSLDSLVVKGFTAASVIAHPIVTKWYASTFA